jgi:hypothetical protein
VTSASEILDRLADIGASVRVDGDRVILAAGSVPVPAELVAEARRHKPALMDLLIEMEERAAIVEYDGGVPRDPDSDAKWQHIAQGLREIAERRPARDPVVMPGAAVRLSSPPFERAGIPSCEAIHAIPCGNERYRRGAATENYGDEQGICIHGSPFAGRRTDGTTIGGMSAAGVALGGPALIIPMQRPPSAPLSRME